MAVFHSIFLLSASLVAVAGSICFVPAALAPRRYASGPYSRTGLTQLSLASSQRDKKEDSKKSRKYATRIPRHQEEAVGITGGLGLWGDTRRRRRKLLKEKWNVLRMKRTGRRRRKLASRFKKYMLRRSLERNDLTEEEEEEEDTIDSTKEDAIDCSVTSLDAMLARSGVLRTRIRLRQESLSDLEKLTRDVRYELRRMDWKNAFDVNAGYTNRTVFMYGAGKEEADENDTGEVMNEYELVAINARWKGKHVKEVDDQSMETRHQENGEEESDNLMDELQLDRMEERSLKLQSSILLDRIRLQRLERRMVCFESNELGIIERAVGNTLGSLNELEFLESNPVMVVQRQAKKFVNTFRESTSVLLRKLDRVSSQSGANNRDYASVIDFAVQETAAGVRIVGNLLSNPSQLSQLVDPETPSLVPHVPAILARLDRLESHVAPILSLVLNNKQHLRTIEPYLDEILERFDD